ncbi:phosphatidylinositol-3-phosphatase SAC1-like isoform X4 [Brassica napus]|uniref:phosphatidylinositol-3-phosphatase SAC1-like isoform X4 n=1 Tax=Brassica napus TaxID=3708 RepID=UPI000BBEC4E0|nr:phosphatidylinositol-3-phosphatase SAC1-like isoform X4 [Brassica napus]
MRLLSLLDDSNVCVIDIPFPGCFVSVQSEIQLKSPNWLFGSRKPEESGSATKPGADDSEKGVTSSERVNDFCNLDWLSEPNDHEEYIFQSCIKSLLALYMYLSITSTNEANGWYGRMVVLSSVTKMKTAKSTDIMLNSVRTPRKFFA